MKKNKIEESGRKGALFVLSVVIVVIAAIGLAIGYGQLRDICLEPCVIRDASMQVTIENSGSMVKADVIAGEFGLKPGVNLAHVDFEKKCAEILKRIPNLKTISVTRTLPDKVTIKVEERTPIVRLYGKTSKTDTGRVADEEGMVFIRQRGTQLLPIIRESQTPFTAVGTKLSGRSLAALRLIESCREPEFSDLGVQQVDTSKLDYLTATLGNYAIAKIAWEGMDTPTPATKKNLDRQLTLLVRAFRSRVGDRAAVWNATDTSSPGRIYADTKGAL